MRREGYWLGILEAESKTRAHALGQHHSLLLVRGRKRVRARPRALHVAHVFIRVKIVIIIIVHVTSAFCF